MQEYLGIRPATDAEGILQDVHWSGGAFGYFPSYTFGAMYACQFYEAMKRETPNLENWIREGKFHNIKQWLSQKIHIKGSRRQGDWEVVGLSDTKVTLRCPISHKEVSWARFCYFAEEKDQAWPQLSDEHGEGHK